MRKTICFNDTWLFAKTAEVPRRFPGSEEENWGSVFESLGDPHVEDASLASFNSQISKVFKVEGRDTFIAMADRWLPKYKVDARIADLFTRAVASTYDAEHYQATEEERREMYRGNALETAQTREADYVWLPIRMENGRPRIAWMDRWGL